MGREVSCPGSLSTVGWECLLWSPRARRIREHLARVAGGFSSCSIALPQLVPGEVGMPAVPTFLGKADKQRQFP